MNFKFLKKEKIITEVWYFVSLLILIVFILELLFPSLVLIYLNPLFFLVLWIILSVYLLFRN